MQRAGHQMEDSASSNAVDDDEPDMIDETYETMVAQSTVRGHNVVHESTLQLARGTAMASEEDEDDEDDGGDFSPFSMYEAPNVENGIALRTRKKMPYNDIDIEHFATGLRDSPDRSATDRDSASSIWPSVSLDGTDLPNVSSAFFPTSSTSLFPDAVNSYDDNYRLFLQSGVLDDSQLFPEEDDEENDPEYNENDNFVGPSDYDTSEAHDQSDDQALDEEAIDAGEIGLLLAEAREINPDIPQTIDPFGRRAPLPPSPLPSPAKVQKVSASPRYKVRRRAPDTKNALTNQHLSSSGGGKSTTSPSKKRRVGTDDSVQHDAITTTPSKERQRVSDTLQQRFQSPRRQHGHAAPVTARKTILEGADWDKVASSMLPNIRSAAQEAIAFGNFIPPRRAGFPERKGPMCYVRKVTAEEATIVSIALREHMKRVVQNIFASCTVRDKKSRNAGLALLRELYDSARGLHDDTGATDAERAPAALRDCNILELYPLVADWVKKNPKPLVTTAREKLKSLDQFFISGSSPEELECVSTNAANRSARVTFRKHEDKLLAHGIQRLGDAQELSIAEIQKHLIPTKEARALKTRFRNQTYTKKKLENILYRAKMCAIEDLSEPELFSCIKGMEAFGNDAWDQIQRAFLTERPVHLLPYIYQQTQTSRMRRIENAANALAVPSAAARTDDDSEGVANQKPRRRRRRTKGSSLSRFPKYSRVQQKKVLPSQIKPVKVIPSQLQPTAAPLISSSSPLPAVSIDAENLPGGDYFEEIYGSSALRDDFDDAPTGGANADGPRRKRHRSSNVVSLDRLQQLDPNHVAAEEHAPVFQPFSPVKSDVITLPPQRAAIPDSAPPLSFTLSWSFAEDLSIVDFAKERNLLYRPDTRADATAAADLDTTDVAVFEAFDTASTSAAPQFDLFSPMKKSPAPKVISNGTDYSAVHSSSTAATRRSPRVTSEPNEGGKVRRGLFAAQQQHEVSDSVDVWKELADSPAFSTLGRTAEQLRARFDELLVLSNKIKS